MKTVIVAVVAACAGTAMAEPVLSGHGSAFQGFGPRTLLVDQSSTGGANFVDQDFGDFPSYSTGVVDDISTGGNTWNLTSMTTYYTHNGTSWAGITSARLSLFSKSGATPGGGDFPFTTTVAVTMTDLGTSWAMTADLSAVVQAQGLNGDYWIGLTPAADFGAFGQEFHYFSNLPVNGDGAAARNPGGSFGFGTDWITGNGGPFGDMLMRIEGNVVPAPASLALVGLGGLVAGRRRR